MKDIFTKMDKVSVIVPVYRAELYVERCVRSLMEQTLDDIEYLFIDDCTPDRSMDIIRDIVNEYPQRINHVKLYKMPINSGSAAVRKYGLSLAKGEYVIHCDSDDYIELDMYANMYAMAKGENLDMVICDFFNSGDNHDIKCTQYFDSSSNEVCRLLLAGILHGAMWNKLVRRDIYINNLIDYPIDNQWEDKALTIQFAFYSKYIGYVNRPLYHYYNNLKSLSNVQTIDAINRRYIQMKNNAELILRFLERNNLTSKYKDEILLMKYSVRGCYDILVDDDEYYKLWRSTYPEVDRNILKSRLLPLREKCRYLLVFFRFYYRFFIIKYGKDSYMRMSGKTSMHN